MNNRVDSLTEKINREIVDHIYKKYHKVILFDSFGAMAFVTLLWGTINHRILLIWLIPQLIINGLGRHILTFFFFHTKPKQIKNVSIWNHLYIGSIFISGLLWGLGGCLSHFTPDPVYRLVIMMYMTGIIGAAIPSYLPSKASNLAFVIPIAISMLFISLSFSGIFSIALIVSVFLYIISSIFSTFISCDTMINSFKLQYINLGLAEDLSNSNNELQQSNISLNERENVLSLIQENAPIGMAIVSISGEWLQVNKALCEIIGYNKSELIGNNFQEITYPVDLENDLNHVRTLLEGKIMSYQIEKRYIQKNGRSIWILLSVSLMRDNDNNPMYFISQIQNIDEQKRREKYSNETKKMNWMLQICHSSLEVYAITNQFAREIFDEFSGGLAIFNNTFNELNIVCNWGDPQLLKKTFFKEDCWALRSADLYLSNKPSIDLICNHYNIPPTGSSICIPLIAENDMIGVINFTASNGKVISDYDKQNIISFTNTIKLSLANIILQELVQEQAIHDVLTGLVNRRYLIETLPREILRILREKKTLCVAMLDLDFFKKINDAFGHEAGDEVLKYFGALLMRNFRGNDICCRYGGEEFIIIMVDSNLINAVPRLEHIRQELENAQIIFQGSPLSKITISIGVAEVPTQASTADEIIRMADEALFAAKNSGRNKLMIANSN